MLGILSIRCEENGHCERFYDGCNVCGCDNGEIGWCTERFCADDSMGVSYCITCEDEETMEYTRCGSCDQTCDQPAPICLTVCQNKCQCKPEYPYYSKELGRCIATDECPSNIPTIIP